MRNKEKKLLTYAIFMCLVLMVIMPDVSSDSIFINGSFTPTGYTGGNITVSSESPINNSVGNSFNPNFCVNISNNLGNNMTVTFRTNVTGSWDDIGTNYTNETVREWYNVNDDENALVHDRVWTAQTFVIGHTGLDDDMIINKVRLKLWRTFTAFGNINVSIQGVNGTGAPDKTNISFGQIDSTIITTSSPGQWYYINMSVCKLDYNTQYALVLSAQEGEASKYVSWRRDFLASVYTSGTQYFSNDNGSSWNVRSADMMFEIYGSINTSTYRYCQVNNSMNQLNTTYWWSTNVTDGTEWENNTYNFRTYNEVSFSSPVPINESWNIITNDTLNCTVSNIGGDSMDVEFYWGSNDTLIGTDTNVANNTVASVTVGFTYIRYHQYSWYAKIGVNTSDSWWFKGEAYNWDINRDKTVNYLDASSLTSHYGETGTPSWIRDDIIIDGVINYLDASSLTSHYGESY